MRVGGHRDAAVALPAGKSKWLPLCMTQGGTHGQYVRVWRKENVVPRPNWNPEQMVVDDQHKSVGVKLHPGQEDVCVSVNQIHAFFTSVLDLTGQVQAPAG